MARRGENFALQALAFCIALFLWWVAHGSSSIERGYDLPLTVRGVPDELVVTGQSGDVLNIRVLGSPAVLRGIDPERLEYVIDASGARPGVSDFEIDTSHLDLPRGARIVSRSPARVAITLERRASRSVPVRADVEGVPAAGYAVEKVEVDPPRVRVSGARGEVLRLGEAVTETIDVSGLTDSIEREVRVLSGGGHVWIAAPGTVRVRIRVGAQAGGGPAKEG